MVAELKSREHALAVLGKDGLALQNAVPELKADRKVVQAAMKQNGIALQHAAAELRADRKIVLAAL